MDYRKSNDKLFIRLDKGDEIISSLVEICRREEIRSGYFQGIGGCGKATVGVFDPEKKTYNEESVSSMLELISLDGNVTEYENSPYIHAHATFAYHKDGEPKLLSGHLLSAAIALTGEIILTPADITIGRRYDENLGIRVWDFN